MIGMTIPLGTAIPEGVGSAAPAAAVAANASTIAAAVRID